ncbi:MAG: nitroreductase family protein [Acidimicrobiia bacterium]|nr:nitroreductase family protein [Acidimicrobiia bacterium]NNF68470.1 nitroreductase family protein [Acidimicrobiia bacterium]NNK92347.1 nitroreductase family protein [Acidimicrobiia bacterium]
MNEDVYQATLRQRAHRRFTDQPVTDDELAKVLEAGRWTGSAKNAQPWGFVVVRDPERKEALADTARFGVPLRAAPMAIALVGTRDAYEFDIGRLAQNMMLAADAIGLGTCPVTLYESVKAKELLKVPVDHHLRYALAVGHPDRSAPSRAPSSGGGRKPLHDIVSDEIF